MASVSAKLECDLEIIVVDDGSLDETAPIAAALHFQDPRIKLLSLSRNFGHQVALAAGLNEASGDAVVVMDADLQHPPELIETLVQKWREGYELVYTVREDTEGVSWAKRASARLFYQLFSRLSALPMPGNVSDFRLMDRKVVLAFRQIKERARFDRGLSAWVGYRSVGIPYTARARAAGISKYGFSRMLGFAVDAIVSFSTKPLRLAIYLGAFFAFLGALYTGYVLYARLFTTKTVPGWSSLVSLVSLIGGAQLFVLGVIGIYVGKIFEEVKQRPLYLVRHSLGLGSGDGVS